ncbi:acetolactate synthase catalytic subunit [Plastoroseomonas hellenica]|uniref:acetolactate synthase catalytic subunit n=1 Tax=Plastoroseomonas hellenica TaxID=2687306 RepID=UPI001BA68EDA|nr:acetolactate synthase catalytic subunit [Plastoroseomonas hellenica]MBR0641744.1 acetolactate synthase catalytic subunit [Plastoroseomonas hellenica]
MLGSAAPNANVALRLAEAFARHGVTTTFGQSLPSAFHLAAPHAGISQTVYRQENMGGTMADGYARISRKVGVVTAQNGPAATLLVPPLAEAMKASVPVIALVQEVNRDTADRNAFQELDHIRLFDAVAKFVRRIDRADRLEDYVDMAFTAATSGRPGPAVLLLPADLLLEKAAAASERRAVLGHFPLDRTLADPARIAEAAALLALAKRPLIIAGGGVHLSGAAEELAALQQDAHLPVATTFMGKGGVDENHPLSLGVVGNTMGLGARTHDLKPMVEQADVVLLVGNRTNQNGTDSWTLYPRTARFIHIDPDPAEIGRNYEALRLVGDAKLTLAALREAMLAQDLAARADARPRVEAEIARAVAGWRALIAGVTSRDGGPVRPERVAAEIDKRLPADGIMVADASYSSNWINIYMTAKRAGQRFLSPRGLAGLGWGVPLAIGAQVAAPDARVVCLCGDGGFGHSWAELETLRRLQVPVTVMVLNNGILGFQKHAEDTKYGDHTVACDFAEVDHAAIARACGIAGVRVERGEDLGAALDAAFASGKPNLIEVITDPDGKPPLTMYQGHYPEPF